jgi:CubicO group peptidase (beta-lactamase class C family)
MMESCHGRYLLERLRCGSRRHREVVSAMKRGGFAGVILAIVAGGGGAVRAQQSPDPAAAVDAIMRGWVPADGPGAALLVLQDGAVVKEGEYGFADVSRKTSIGRHTRFLLGSVSKQFTAMAVMILAERGQLSYDDRMRKYLPEFPTSADSITVRDLLNHLGGLPEYEELFMETGKVGHDWPRSIRAKPSPYEPTAADALQLLATKGKARFSAGDRFEYSNSGYMLLAQVVERVTGERFAAFVQREIFDRLGMTESVLYDETTPPIPNRASSYRKARAGFEEIDYTPFNHIYGEDNVVATIGDVGRWVLGLDSARLVGRPTLDLAYTPGRTRAGGLTRYGFGWFIGRSLGVPVVTHGGSWIGFRTVIRRYPEQHLAVVVLANWAEADPEAVAARVAAVYLGDRLERRVPATVADRVVTGYLGRYWFRPGIGMTLRRGPGKDVWLDTPMGAARLVFDSDSTAFVGDNPAMGVTFRGTSLVFHHLESDFEATRASR